MQGDKKYVDQILEDDDGDLHFAIARFPSAAAEEEPESTAEPEVFEPNTTWEELQGVGAVGKGYGQAVGMHWDSKNAPTVLGRFFGYFCNGVPSGHGKLEYDGGDIFFGQVADGKPHGWGKQTLADGSQYWGLHESGHFGQTGGGVGVWANGKSGHTKHGLWDESDDSSPDGLLEELDEEDEQIETCFQTVEKAVESAGVAVQKAQEAITRQKASESTDQVLRQGVGQRAYEAMSLRLLFPQDSSAVAPGGVVERIEQRAATAPA